MDTGSPSGNANKRTDYFRTQMTRVTDALAASMLVLPLAGVTLASSRNLRIAAAETSDDRQLVAGASLAAHAELAKAELAHTVPADVQAGMSALLDLYIDAINQSVTGRPKDMVIGVHVCRGNYKGHYLGQGSYEAVAERFVKAAQAMQQDGWCWADPALTNKTIKRGILREIFAHRFGRA